MAGPSASSTRPSCPGSSTSLRLTDEDQVAARHPLHADARRAADRRRRRPMAWRWRCARDPRPRTGAACARCWARPGRPRSTCAGRSSACARALRNLPPGERAAAAYAEAAAIADDDVDDLRGDRPERPAAAAGDRGAQAERQPVNVLTHCNAGWLATRRLGHRAGADLPWRMMPGCRCMSGWTRRGRATRARR